MLLWFQEKPTDWEACEAKACEAKDHKLTYHEEGKKHACDHRCQRIDYHPYPALLNTYEEMNIDSWKKVIRDLCTKKAQYACILLTDSK